MVRQLRCSGQAAFAFTAQGRQETHSGSQYEPFDTEREARDYGDQVQAMLDRGVVPQELIAPAPKGHDPLLIEVIRAYTKEAPITDSDDALLTYMLPELAGTRISSDTTTR